MKTTAEPTNAPHYLPMVHARPWRSLYRGYRSYRRRSMLQFACDEVVIPTGRYAGERFEPDRNPWTRLFFDAVDSGLWPRIAATGMQQSGKTLCCFAIPALYHLFELRETFVIALPDMKMAQDKWQDDLLPLIEASRFRDLLPIRGEGARRGMIKRAVTFQNGATLRFLTAGGGDKKRAGKTARAIAITETDGFDEPGATSREADKISQIEGRARSFGRQRRIYLECTVSVERGRIWQEYSAGTRSRIVQRCPHCGEYVALQREDLIGWREAENLLDAVAAAQWQCNRCQQPWSESDRRAAALESRLLHHGQEIDVEGNVIGDAPRTDTLGFRWTPPDNLLLSAGDVAEGEWKAARSVDPENDEKAQLQFVWVIPHKPSILELAQLDPAEIGKRTTNDPRGMVPVGTIAVTVGLDLGQHLCHWVAIGWREGASGHVVDYGRLEVPSRELGLERGLLHAMRHFRDSTVRPGWPMVTTRIGMCPSMCWVDAQWGPAGRVEVVDRFVDESNALTPDGWLAAAGHGAGQHNPHPYSAPSNTGPQVVRIGDNYHIARVKRESGQGRTRLAEVNVDHWKSWVHERLRVPVTSPGAMTLFNGPALDHRDFARHLTAEKQIEEFKPGKGGRGIIIRWERVHRANHWLDALMLACAAGHFIGVRLLDSAHGVASGNPREKMHLADWFKTRTNQHGQPYLLTDR